MAVTTERQPRASGEQRTKADLAGLSPREVRAHIEAGTYEGDSWGLAPGYAQTAFVGLPREFAFDFLTFAQRNPRPCPLLEVIEPGERLTRTMAAGADVTTSLSRYRVFEAGQMLTEATDVQDYWTHDMVGFLIGCTGSFETHMQRSGVTLRNLDEGIIVPVFLTDRMCEPAGRLSGPLAVSMRLIKHDQVTRVVQLTSRFPAFHGAPIHIGGPEALGIHDLSRPWAGDAMEVRDDEVPVFWGCSVTPQLVAQHSNVPLMITNAPAYMFLTERRTEDMAVLA